MALSNRVIKRLKQAPNETELFRVMAQENIITTIPAFGGYVELVPGDDFEEAMELLGIKLDNAA